MGGVKKVFKSIGGLIGLGSSEKAQVAPVTTEPTPTVVTDTSADTGSGTAEAKKAKRRKGFASTQVAGDTILGGSASGERSTLG
jgi:hypothetical protein